MSLKQRSANYSCPWPSLQPSLGGGEAGVVLPEGTWEGHQCLLPLVREKQPAGSGGDWGLTSLDGQPSSSGGETTETHFPARFFLRKHLKLAPAPKRTVMQAPRISSR